MAVSEDQDRFLLSTDREGAEAQVREATLAEQLYLQLSEAILNGQLAPGSKISEPVLARQHGVSRGPLREALHRLQERKLITRSANQGPRVVQPSVAALVELFVVREALEGMAARMAAMHATEVEIARLRNLLNESGTAPEASASPFDGRDQDFHVTIAQCSRSPMLIDLLCGELYPLLRFYRGTLKDRQPRGERASTEHMRIVDAIEDRDADLAELLMRRHIVAARKRRTDFLKEHDMAAPPSGC